MWIATKHGFLSAVTKDPRKRPDEVQVRSRDFKSLEHLAEWLKPGKAQKLIKTGQGTDYPYRLTTDRASWSRYLAEQAAEIDYPNFKDELKSVRGWQFAHTFSRVWSVLLDLTPPRVQRREDARWVSYRSAGSSKYSYSSGTGYVPLEQYGDWADEPEAEGDAVSDDEVEQLWEKLIHGSIHDLTDDELAQLELLEAGDSDWSQR